MPSFQMASISNSAAKLAPPAVAELVLVRPMRLLAILFMLFVMAASCFATSTADSIVGRWSDGKGTMDFRRDGTVVAKPPGAEAVTLKYRTEADKVIVINRAGNQLVHQIRDDVLLGPAGERLQRWAHVTVIFEFVMASDGSRKDIKVFRYEDPADRHELKEVLTEKEKRSGIAIMAQRKHPVGGEDVGKTKYDFLLFDKHTRKYLPR